MIAAFRPLLLLCLGLCCVCAPLGCTNDTTTSPGTLTRAVTFKIVWGPTTLSDAISAPSQARSASLKLLQANANGTDLVFPVKRDLSASTLNQSIPQNYPVPSPVRVGPLILQADFYEKPDPIDTDKPIGTLMTTKNVAPTGMNTIVIDTQKPPASIVIAPGQSVIANGDPKTLVFTPLDTDGVTAIPINLLSQTITITVTDGTDHLAWLPGTSMVKGLTSGTAHVVVTLNTPTAGGNVATSSLPETVAVNPKVHVSVDPPPNPLSVQTGTYTFKANVTNIDGSTPENTKVFWSVQETNGGTINSSSGAYTAPPMPGTFHVVATSQADTSVTGTTAVTVQKGSASVTFQ